MMKIDGSSQHQDVRIKCILLCEFHPTAGPKITFQVPEEYITKEIFDAVSVYIIPKQQLHRTVITVNALGYKIVGYPVGIESPKYIRNSLIFNVCFVCDDTLRTVQYEPVVRKLSSYLVSLEMENDFLSNDNRRQRLPHILQQILTELNSRGQCSIPINESNTLHLRVVKILPPPPKVEDYHVPIFLLKTSSFISSQWDLTTQQILPYVDGLRHIARIAAETDVEIGLVKQCVENMVYHGVVTIVPLFQYSNVYRVTPEIQKLAESKQLQEECIKYVSKSERHMPTFRNVFMLYCGMTPGTTVRDLCIRYNPHSVYIDEIKLVQFGVMKGIIHRLHKYPVQLTPDPQASVKQRNLTKMFNGLSSYDEICCKTGLSYQELDEKVESDPRVVVCWK